MHVHTRLRVELSYTIALIDADIAKSTRAFRKLSAASSTLCRLEMKLSPIFSLCQGSVGASIY